MELWNTGFQQNHIGYDMHYADWALGGGGVSCAHWLGLGGKCIEVHYCDVGHG
jgi:hypothetical protein